MFYPKTQTKLCILMRLEEETRMKSIFLEPGIFFLTYGDSPSLLLVGISITILRERLLMDVGEIVAFFTSLWVYLDDLANV